MEIVMSDSAPYLAPSTPVEHNDLDQLKRQAKELLKALRKGELSALELASKHYRGTPLAEYHLTDAQLIIARHHGFESWAKLRAEVDAVNLKRLVSAVQASNLKEASKLLKERPALVSFDLAENNEHRVLHFAVLKRDEPMVRLLVKAGADPHKGIYPHREATTAYVIAKERGFSEIVAAIEEEERFRQRQMSGSNATISPNQEELSHAIRGGSHQAALAILEVDAAIAQACDRKGNTALHIACEAGAMPVIDWLLEHDADCGKANLKGWTPLEHAILSIPSDKKAECVARFPTIARKLIRHGAEIKPLVAAAMGDAEALHALRAWHRRRPESLTEDHLWGQSCGVMGAAVLFSQPTALKALLDLGLDPDEPQRLPDIEEAVYSRGGPLSGAAGSGEYEMATLLLEHGADPNTCVYASGTPMDGAYRTRDERMKTLLAAHGAKPSASTLGSFREVEAARRMLSDASSEEFVTELLRTAASGGSPEIVQMCLERINWEPADKRWPLAEPLRIWNHSPINPHPETYDRSTYPECLRLLLAAGADPNRFGRFGDSLLHHIAAMGRVWGVEVMTTAERLQFAQITLQFKPDLTLRDHLLHSTPLGWACRWGRAELVQLLVENGAPVNEPEAEPWATPLAWANKMGHEKIAAYLISKGAK